MVPASRLHPLNDREPHGDGEFVLYWMVAQRRLRSNFALDYAIEQARKFRRPLLILEGLNCSYRWASHRFHRFILDGMAEHQEQLANSAVRYYPYAEKRPGEGAGLVEALAKRACLVVTDLFPCFEIPRWTQRAADQVSVTMTAVDSNGLLPIRAGERPFTTAHSFRRHLQKSLPQHLDEMPHADPLQRLKLPTLNALPAGIESRWPEHTMETPLDRFTTISSEIAVAPTPGGTRAAQLQMRRFVDELQRYETERNHPDSDATSGLSPYLHFGHLSSHDLFRAIVEHEGWSPDHLGARTDGARAGWWGMSPAAEAFIDQFVTWREVGYNGCFYRDDFDRYDSLPAWALATLTAHRDDPRPHRYTLEQFASSETHSELWNAAQTQLREEGVMHNYLRMAWGKKILEWTESPEIALDIMIELNNRYALDGRNPNSYSGIFWVLGRYDRAWGPERPIYGKVRYMTLANTARKVRLKQYLKRYTPTPPKLF